MRTAPDSGRNGARALAGVALLSVALTSCSRYQAVDPVFGRQRIPAQRTGGVGVSRNGNAPPPPGYYDGGTSGGSGNLPAAPGGNPLAPPGGFGFSGSTTTTTPDSGGWGRPGSGGSLGGASGGASGAGIPPRAGPDEFRPRPPDNYGPSQYDRFPDSAAPLTSPPPASGGSHFPPPRSGSLPAAPGSGADNWQSPAPVRSASFERYEGAGDNSYISRYGQAGAPASAVSQANARGEIPDIMDLPPRGARQAEPIRATPSSASTSGGDASGSFGYERDYRWLKGRLEFSPASRRWKLRYIPITGRTDENGGSVMLEDSPALKDPRPGDAVLVEGRIVGDGEAGSFAPLYRADRISRLQ